jgi:RHS repeat-associated protein
VKKVVDGETTHFHYDVDGLLICETDGNGNAIRDYVYLDGEPVAMRVAGDWFWFLNDHLGTPRKMVDASGAVVWKAAYLPFGRAIVAKADVENNLRFPGQYFDAETGLHYNWHRYYDPGTGRYFTADPIGLAGGINLFVYVSNNPINAIDPYGLKGPLPVPGTSTTSNVAKGVFASRWLTGVGAFFAAMAPVPAGEGSDIIPSGPTGDADPCAKFYFRLESPTQTPEIAKMQELTGEIWGRAPRGSNFPTVQAYKGTLPIAARGIEFTTPVAPDPGSPPGRANWRGPRPGVTVKNDFAIIKVVVTKNTQK